MVLGVAVGVVALGSWRLTPSVGATAFALAADDSEPEELAPEGSEPEDSELEELAPEGSAPDDSEPDAVAPEDSESDVSEPDAVAPEDSESDVSAPDAIAPEDSEQEPSAAPAEECGLLSCAPLRLLQSQLRKVCLARRGLRPHSL